MKNILVDRKVAFIALFFFLILAPLILSPIVSTADSFGADLGQFNTVVAKSNGNGGNSGISNSTGLEWQCVEYVRRYYLTIFNMDFSSKYHGNANGWYEHALDSGSGLQRFPNRGTTAPQVGDILASNYGDGHVAIVKSIANNRVCTIQQNFLNNSSDTDKCMTLTVTKNGSNNIYSVDNFDFNHAIQGWIRPSNTPGQSQATWHPDGTLLLDENGTVWLIENGKKRGIQDEWTFVTYGFNWYKLIKTNSQELSCYASESNLPDVTSRKLLRRPDGATFLITDKGFKRGFASEYVFLGLGYRWGDVTNVSNAAEVNQYPDDPVSPLLTSPVPDGTLIKKASEDTVYVITNGKRRGFSSLLAFQKRGYSFDHVVQVSDAVMNSIVEITPAIGETGINNCIEVNPNPVGSVTVNATLNGQPWPASGQSGSVEYSVVGPNHVVMGYAVPITTNNLSTGQYTLTYKSGGPDSLVSITPSATQTLNTNGLITFTMNFGGQGGGFDEFGPNLSITSHSDGQTVTTSTVTISGTASDAGRGESGIASVTVNGIRANGDTAAQSDTAYWSKAITLSPGANTITVVATDNSPIPNQTTQTITLNLSSSGGGGGSGGVIVLATGLSNPNGITTDGSYVYWTDYGSNSVKRVSVNGGSVTTLYNSIYSPSGIAVDSSYVYFGFGSDVMRVPKNGGTANTLASAGAPIMRLAVDGSYVYWTSYVEGTIKKVPLTGGAIITLASGQPSPFGITLADNKVFWSEFNNPGAIRYVGSGGGSVGILASNSNTPGLASDGTNIYWTENVLINGGKVNKVSTNGGTPTAIATGLDRPYDLTVDGTSAFWTEGYSGGYIKQVSLSGGTPIILASGLADPTAITLDSTNVYWIERSDGGQGTGTLKKVAKGVVPSGGSPTVTTAAAGTVTSSSATLSGSVNPNGLATNAWFEWGTDSTLSSNNNLTAAQAVGSGNMGVSVYADLSGLTPNTTYYFRPVAANSAGTNRGAIQSFTTQSGTVSSGCSDYALETTITNLTQPIWLGVSGGKLFSTSPGKVQVIDLSSNTLSATISFSPYPNAYGGGIAFLNGKAYIPLGNLGSQAQVAIVDTATNTVTGYIPVGAEPYGITIYNGKLYVTHSVQWSNGTPSTVDVIDPNSNSVTSSINTGINTQDIAIVPLLNRGYAVNYVSATATIIDLGTNTTSGTISLPINPRSVVFAAGKIYVAGSLLNSQYGQVIVIDPATNSIALRIDVGRDPTDLAVLDNRVFVTNQADRNLMVINTDTNTVIKTMPMGMVTTGVAVNSSTGKIYVANQGGPTISVVACAPLPCTYVISPANQSFQAGGGTGSVSVSAGNGCAWTATSDAGFLSVTSGSSGSSNGTVAFSVAANSSTSQRTGTITIAGQTFTVTQEPSPPPPTPSSTNLAVGRTATQSSDPFGAPASRAIDGNTDGDWYHNSITHTGYDNQAWWQVDLGSVQYIDAVKVWNRTDAVPDRLSNFYVFVSDVPFTSTDLLTTQSQPGVARYSVPGQGGVETNISISRSGRYVRVQLAGFNYLSLAEVQVWGNPAAQTNLALNQSVSQSSNPFGAPASRAADGNTDGNWSNNSVTHTGQDSQAWWQVDLSIIQSIGTIKVWNRTDAVTDRLSNFYVFVSDVPFASTDLTTTLNQSGVTSYYTAGQGGVPTTIPVNRTGRYVRVQLSGTNYLSLAEVQVLSPASTQSNMASSKSATQSSDPFGAPASRAVDGNTSGNWGNNSVTHTGQDNQAWWQVDLGSTPLIQSVQLWNRTDAVPERLSNFYVFVSNVPFTSTDLTTTLNQPGVSAYYTSGQADVSTTINLNRTGRYIRVQLTGANYLSLAEVQVWGN
ncbi:MAG: hypothetical protein QOJ02_4113 [Acidobacteriota bacterium]|nr:hypothetical protein [Acidobacteriota bacterium]